jgi:cbb3-type cytochrome oxidase subunit 3
MKFINYLKAIAGVEVFPMISLFIFFLFFVALVVWAVKVNKQYITEMKNIPFDNDDVSQNRK